VVAEPSSALVRLLQGHERAYFDSAEWSMNKVRDVSLLRMPPVNELLSYHAQVLHFTPCSRPCVDGGLNATCMASSAGTCVQQKGQAETREDRPR